MTPDNIELEPLLEEATGLLKALAHPARLRICCELRDQEMSVSDIESTLDIKQPNLSRELAKLREDGLVETRRESKLVFYTLSSTHRVRKMVDVICAVMLARQPDIDIQLDRPTPKTRRVDGGGVFARTGNLTIVRKDND